MAKEIKMTPEEMYEKGYTLCKICNKPYPRSEMLFTRDCYGIPFRLVCLSCYDKAMRKGYDGEYYTEADECLNDDY